MAPGGDIVVFAGPSLPAADRPGDGPFSWRAPAIAGDTRRLGSARPKAVVLIDGLFDEQPAIRHKELLELIAEGVFVIGGASMGALRAAELAPFGMIGVGRIFQAYAAGRLTADDEVALLHGPAAWGHGPLTEPLVNIRATLLRAARDRVIEVVTARRVLNTARAIFYKERTWPDILDAARREAGDSDAALAALRAWLPAGRVDIKRLDALDCLDRALRLGDPPPPARPFPPRTLYFDDLSARIAAL